MGLARINAMEDEGARAEQALQMEGVNARANRNIQAQQLEMQRRRLQREMDQPDAVTQSMISAVAQAMAGEEANTQTLERQKSLKLWERSLAPTEEETADLANREALTEYYKRMRPAGGAGRDGAQMFQGPDGTFFEYDRATGALRERIPDTAAKEQPYRLPEANIPGPMGALYNIGRALMGRSQAPMTPKQKQAELGVKKTELEIQKLKKSLTASGGKPLSLAQKAKALSDLEMLRDLETDLLPPDAQALYDEIVGKQAAPGGSTGKIVTAPDGTQVRIKD